jgi:hypothetical protein
MADLIRREDARYSLSNRLQCVVDLAMTAPSWDMINDHMQPDPRDAVIARLVDAVKNMLAIRAVWTDPHNDTDCDNARAAIAASKEVMK